MSHVFQIRKRKRIRPSSSLIGHFLEPLEQRTLLSGVHPLHLAAAASAHHQQNVNSNPAIMMRGWATITFDQAPTNVQTGLTTLAATDNVTAPTSTSTVYLGNADGIETYTVVIGTTGTTTKLTVDVNGNPVTAPTASTTTFGAITNTAVTTELTTIAAALNATAPTSNTSVTVTTASNGAITYSIALSPTTSSTTTTTAIKKNVKKSSPATHSALGGTVIVSVDANGNPTGDEKLPLSVFSTTIQNALTSNAPAGATALTAASLITVRTLDGVTTYSATYTSTGITTTVTVNTAGQLTNLPSTSTTTYAQIPSAAQTELQALATAAGITTTIAADQLVEAYDEANGTIVYSVTLPTSSSSSTGATYTYLVTLSSDENGNPTLPPDSDFGGFSDFGGHCH